MNPIIALCDFTAYPALLAEKIYLDEKLSQIRQDIESLQDISAIQYDKEPTQNHVEQSSILVKVITEETQTLCEIERISRRIQETEDLLKSLPKEEQTFVREKYFSCRTWQQMADRFNMSPGAIDYHIRKALERI